MKLATCPNLRQLRVFEAVAKHCNISKAASEVGLSQPALTSSVAALEKTLKTRLFNRTGRGTFPNEVGIVLLRRIERMHAAIDAAIAFAAASNMSADEVVAMRHRLTASQVQVLLAAFERGGMANASFALGLSEHSVERSMREVERSIGQRLHFQDASGATLTPKGREFARRLKVALTDYGYAVDEIRAQLGLAGQHILVGSLSFAKNHILPNAIERIVLQFRDIQVEVVEGTYDALLADLRDGTIDLLVGALRGPAAAEDVLEELLFMEPYCIVVGPGHPLLRRSEVHVEELLDYEWILPRQGSPMRNYYNLLFSSLPKSPKHNIETSDFVTVRALLQRGERVSILSPSQIQIDRRAELLFRVPLKGPEVVRKIGVATRRHWLPTSRHAELIQILRTTMP